MSRAPYGIQPSTRRLPYAVPIGNNSSHRLN